MTVSRSRRDVLFVSMEQMIEIDRIAMHDLGIDLVQMMENAGRNLARLARKRFLLYADPVGKSVLVLAGTGGNGGGALACALWVLPDTQASSIWRISAFLRASMHGQGSTSGRSFPSARSFAFAGRPRAWNGTQFPPRRPRSR